MARISTYTKDTAISGGDKVIGTDEISGDTVNFLVQDLADYIATDADNDVSVSNLEARLAQIDSNVTIGNGPSVDTTISGDLNVTGNLTVTGTSNLAGLTVDSTRSLTLTVKNTSGGLLAKGTVVHTASTQSSSGQIIDVVKADNSTAAGMPALAVLNVQLADDGEGEAISFGIVTNIDTSSFSSGDELYVGTNGNFTNVKPTGTALIQKIAVVIKSHPVAGSIEVFGAGRANDVPNISDGSIFIGNASGVATPTPHNIINITDVNITNLQDNQILKYDSSTAKWVNEADSGGSGSSVLPITLDTTNNRIGVNETSPDVPVHITGSAELLRLEGSAGSSLKIYQGTNEAVDLNYVYDGGGATNRLEINSKQGDINLNTGTSGSATTKMTVLSGGNIGVGTTTPRNNFHIQTGSTVAASVVESTDTQLLVAATGDNNSEAGLQIYGGTYGKSNIFFGGGGNTKEGRIVHDNFTTKLSVFTNNVERLTILEGGDIGIGITSPTEKLDVDGEVKASGGFSYVTGTSTPARESGTTGLQFYSGTKAQYNALAKDNNTIYFITDE